MPRTRPAYPEQFRREAVELVRSGRSIADVAESLGVSAQTLRNRNRQLDVDGEHRQGLSSDDKEELTSCAAACGSSSRSVIRIGEDKPGLGAGLGSEDPQWRCRGGGRRTSLRYRMPAGQGGEHTSVVSGQPRQATATSRARQISRMRESASRPRRVTSAAIETLSMESRLTAERRDRVIAGFEDVLAWERACTARPVLVRAAGFPRHGQDDDGTPADLCKLTPPRLAPEPAARSRGGSGLPKRREVTPLVGLVERVLVVDGVACVHLGGAVAIEQRFQGRVDEGGVGDPHAHEPSAPPGGPLHGRAQSCASHAIRMPR